MPMPAPLPIRARRWQTLVQLWELVGLRAFLTFYITTAGTLFAAAGDRARARRHYDDALALADETGMHFYDAETFRRIAQLSRARPPGSRGCARVSRSRARKGHVPSRRESPVSWKTSSARHDLTLTRPRGRVAILGGGMAGLAAAWRLSEPGSRGELESITVYQRGWRLGGKGASSRGSNGRIEEHGLHLWLGYYENSFRLLRECYAGGSTARRQTPSSDPNLAGRVSLRGTLGSKTAAANGWHHWLGQFTSNDLFPGEPEGAAYEYTIDGLLAPAPRARCGLPRVAPRHDIPSRRCDCQHVAASPLGGS